MKITTSLYFCLFNFATLHSIKNTSVQTSLKYMIGANWSGDQWL